MAAGEKARSQTGFPLMFTRVEHDEKEHKLVYFRVFSGSIRQKDKVLIAGTEQEITINNLRTVNRGKQIPAQK